jgi:adenylate kinase
MTQRDSDLDFEEVSLLRERSEALKEEYTTYLEEHPEIEHLLSALVNSCLVQRPTDIFAHAAEHFGGTYESAADHAEALLAWLRKLQKALRTEAGDDMSALLKHVFYTFDANHNGTLEEDEWFEFLSDFGEPHGLDVAKALSDEMHAWACGEVHGHMSAAQLIHALAWLENGERGEFFALEPEPSAAAAAPPPGGGRTVVQTGGVGAAAPTSAVAAAATIAPPRLIISGAPASGKGTQCEGIVAAYGVKHISTGDLLRAAVKAGTALGVEAKGYMERGELVPDKLLIPLVAEGLDGVTQGWLLDGFPRTKVQAEALRDAGVTPDAMIVLDVPHELLVDRCVHRRIDPETGKIYHLVTNPPEDPAITERLVHRSDDTAEKIQTRLKLYKESADAVCSVFADQVRRVKGDESPEAVRAAIARIIDTGADSQMEASAARIQASYRGQAARKHMKAKFKSFDTEQDKWVAFLHALEAEAEKGGYQLPVLMKHVFYSFDADNNGTLEKVRWRRIVLLQRPRCTQFCHRDDYSSS